ncbi:MAG: TIGR01212 family radical SAM protein [Pontiellaceae bacterium]|nr:TIGR01212 family radical SAM protein [Pontiellaceae bacterium]
MIKRHGQALFRVPIDFGLGCPNREADGSGGCTFCNARGAAAVQTLGAETVQEQVRAAIQFSRERYGAKKFMAYIQAFSATFGPEQQPLYRELFTLFDFSAISIGTRPDCLTPQAYHFLTQLNERIETWVELGVQTCNDRTLQRINRGHDWASSEQAIQRLHERGIKVAVHVILGLPGETAKDFQATADTLAALPIDAVKIHNLHIEKGTALAKEFNVGRASCLTSPKETDRQDACPTFDAPLFMEHDYAEHLMDFIRRMPPNIPIMRLTTDTLDDELIAPKWHMAKGQFKDYVIQQMTCREWHQGDLYKKLETGNGKLETGNLKPETRNLKPETGRLKTVETEDGSTTFWNEDYKEHYHTPAGARLEAEEKYIVPGKLSERLERGDVRLLDVCFGLGYNSLAALNLAAGKSKLEITALEMDRRVVGAAAQSIQPSASDTFDWRKTLTDLYLHEKSIISPKRNADHFQHGNSDAEALHQHSARSAAQIISRQGNSDGRAVHPQSKINPKHSADNFQHGNSDAGAVNRQSAIIHWGDARYTSTKLEANAYDLVFLDAFSTQRNSELWTVDFFKKLRRLMKPDALLLTYCAAIPVRSGLIEAGFFVGETEPVGRQRGGTLAAMRSQDIEIPLPDHELNMIKETTRGLPYRDPYGIWTNKEILRDRQERILAAKAQQNS